MARPSRTAEQVALIRAVETVRQGPRIFHDPYATAFLRPRWRALATVAGIPRLGRGVEHYLNHAQPPGPRANVVIRTRVIDELVNEALQSGVTQVLLLGAGYDCRPYRLPGMRSTRVFEVDQPVIQQRKRLALTRAVGRPGMRHVRFVPVDLAVDDLDAALERAGFQAGRTLVLCEGVVSYLDDTAVGRLLKWVATRTATGSGLIFTYLDRSVVFGDPGNKWVDSVRKVGEPFRFGFDPARLADDLAEHGLRLAVHMSATKAAREYLNPLGRSEPTADFSRIAMAEVAEQSAATQRGA